jgi:hypothetical protein
LGVGQQQSSTDRELEPEVRMPEEEKIHVGNGGDNYSLFKMMQEGLIDIDKEKARDKK